MASSYDRSRYIGIGIGANNLAIRASAVAQCLDDLFVSPLANPGLNVGSDKDDDKVFTVYEGKSSAPWIITGTNQWTGGTGKFTGIQGNNTFRVTSIGKNPASWIVWEGEWRLP